ncbi:hypothetical protein KNT56_gp167 [Escherichia phage phT4A]|uniref:Uncharacterized protein n=1 Tax=Escherichia phage phT4A TaxID=1852638 RepID=A0A193GZ68_9CAUD|nr:hypothetical protein KNT56_gp167 [Escherichia phage phT4A]ANN86433.1 hypothetical protein [Escherichia phage phT4A]
MENQLTLIDICKSIRDAVLTKASEVTVYSSWSAEFGYEEIVNFPDRLKNTKWFRYIDPNEFSLDELEELNFSRWDEHSGLRLIPLWLLPYIDPEAKVLCIDGNEVLFKDADNDHRFGMLAYGVKPKA